MTHNDWHGFRSAIANTHLLRVLRSAVLATISLLPLGAAHATPNTGALLVTAIAPSPNYLLSTDPNDLLQLTDGTTGRHPLWIQQGAVGWSERTPVRIELQLKAVSQHFTLRLHTACGHRAEVGLPRRVDLYAEATRGWTHTAAFQQDKPLECDRDSWIEMPVQTTARKLQLIIHSSDRFLAIDEIAIATSAASSPPAAPSAFRLSSDANAVADSTKSDRTPVVDARGGQSLLPDVAAAVADSVARLKSGIAHRSAEQLRGQLTSLYKQLQDQDFMLWEQDPWAPAEQWFNSVYPSAMPSVTLHGTSAETEVFCLGVLFKGSFKNRKLLVTSDTDEAIGISQLLPVLAADGSTVYDRLTPLPDRRLTVTAGDPAYLWVKVDLSKYAPGLHRFQIGLVDLDTGSSYGTAQIALNVTGNDRSPSPLSVINWAYPDQSPIWNDPASAFAELLSGATNVFTVAAGAIPGVTLDGNWQADRQKLFDDQVRRFRQHGQIVLFLNWTQDNNPLFGKASRPDALQAYRQWLQRLTSHLESLGVPRSRWMLYPVDEPRDAEFVLLRKVAIATRQIDPSIRIYANPTTAANLQSQLKNMSDMNHLVHTWQPDWRLPLRMGAEPFQGLQRPWWIFAVPTSPAKTAPPLQLYRMLPWQAWRWGATGVGFWSYSGTSNSSALDDFDALRPDFSVVYENPVTALVESSRRWEAFKQGLEDYQLLALAGVKRNSIQNPDQYDAKTVEAARAQALTTLMAKQHAGLNYAVSDDAVQSDTGAAQ